MEEITLVKKILNNEFAQISGIAIAIWFFVVNVILPITNIQAQLSEIQLTLADIKSTNTTLEAKVNQNSSDILVIKSQIGD